MPNPQLLNPLSSLLIISSMHLLSTQMHFSFQLFQILLTEYWLDQFLAIHYIRNYLCLDLLSEWQQFTLLLIIFKWIAVIWNWWAYDVFYWVSLMVRILLIVLLFAIFLKVLYWLSLHLLQTSKSFTHYYIMLFLYFFYHLWNQQNAVIWLPWNWLLGYYLLVYTVL